MSPQLAFVTNRCPHYRTGFFEQFDNRLGDQFDYEILFTDEKEGWKAYGNFNYRAIMDFELHEHYSIAPTLFYHLWRRGPDVIVAGPLEQFAGQAAYLYAQLTDTPFVLWTGEWRLPITTLRTTTFPLIKRIYHGADALVVYGPHIRDYVTDLGVNPDDVYVAWNTTDIERFSNPDSAAVTAVRESLGIPSDAPVALFVGRHVKEKGLEYLIDAFRDVINEVKRTPYLVVVGNGDRHDAIRNRASDLETILFPGYIENEQLPPYYGLADVFVLPSILTEEFREPWGLVVNEAMGSGTPVIATSEVGAAAAGVVKDGENGYIVPERNSEVLADRLSLLLSNLSKSTKMGRSAFKTIKKFDYDNMTDGFKEAISHARGQKF